MGYPFHITNYRCCVASVLGGPVYSLINFYILYICGNNLHYFDSLFSYEASKLYNTKIEAIPTELWVFEVTGLLGGTRLYFRALMGKVGLG